MSETTQQLHDSKQIAEHVYRLLLGTMNPVPEFGTGSVPVPVAAAVYGKDANWVRAGIISGWLPIGRAVRAGVLVTDIAQMDSSLGKISYQISPRKLWEDTGYIWKGEKSIK